MAEILGAFSRFCLYLSVPKFRDFEDIGAIGAKAFRLQFHNH